jgi:hypothetical protein
MSEERINSQFPKENPFVVPDGYFDTLDKRIEARVNAGNLPQRQRVIRIIKPIMGLAASFLLAFLLIRYPLDRILSEQNTNSEIATYDDFFRQLTEDIDENTLYQVLTEEEDDSYASDEMIDLLLCSISDLDIYYNVIE